MENISRISTKMKLDSPSMAFKFNVMSIIEEKEIKWTFSYFLKNILPFGIITLMFISIFILNILGISLPNILDFVPQNISDHINEYRYYKQIFAGSLSILFTVIFTTKQLKNKFYKI